MLDMKLLEYRVVYEYSPHVKIEIYKVGLDWGWVVRHDGEVMGVDIATSENDAEHSALSFVKGRQDAIN